MTTHVPLFNIITPPLIAVPLHDPISRHTILAAQKNGATLIELRIDMLSNTQLPFVQKQIAQCTPMPILGTIRSSLEGGNWRQSEDSRLNLFGEIMHSLDAIDIEFSAEKIRNPIISLAKKNKKTVIVSYHNFTETPSPDRLTHLIKKAKETGPHIIKIATMVNRAEDIQTLKTVLATAKVPLCILGMGKKGQITRSLFPKHGSCLTFGHLGTATAPGQTALPELVAQLAQSQP